MPTMEKLQLVFDELNRLQGIVDDSARDERQRETALAQIESIVHTLETLDFAVCNVYGEWKGF